MRILHAKDYKRTPWKNGGGETREIAVYPDGAGMADFDWRISMALVASDGPFSTFPGIERTLTILSGGPMALAFAGEMPIELQEGSKPLSFPADAPVSARLLGPPVTDLNVMTRLGAFSHEVEIIKIRGALHVIQPGPIHIVFSMEGALQIASRQGSADLKSSDCCLFDAQKSEFKIIGEGKAALISIHAAQ